MGIYICTKKESLSHQICKQINDLHVVTYDYAPYCNHSVTVTNEIMKTTIQPTQVCETMAICGDQSIYSVGWYGCIQAGSRMAHILFTMQRWVV